ncbi:MAG: L-threonylcarbamoyladenylate synthase [Verrucomicrobia bacterium]|nr:L-threonylcarbamoyladenylate synthase [Verrucomicrobiota bacterium]MDA1088412.1 L-threonylcarbamoyladenylate synthase [Verrucomicrobiota bacterium]
MNPTTRLVTDAERPHRWVIREAARRLRRGEIALIPTDTVYGLAVHPGAPNALESLARVKARDPDKPVAFLVDSSQQVTERYGALPGLTGMALMEAYWPGPLTLVLPVGDGHEGFRMPRHAVALALLTACGGALRVTSANRSGEPEARCVDEALAALPDGVGFALDSGPAGALEPSTVVRVGAHGHEILREGSICSEDIGNVIRSARS